MSFTVTSQSVIRFESTEEEDDWKRTLLFFNVDVSAEGECGDHRNEIIASRTLNGNGERRKPGGGLANAIMESAMSFGHPNLFYAQSRNNCDHPESHFRDYRNHHPGFRGGISPYSDSHLHYQYQPNSFGARLAHLAAYHYEPFNGIGNHYPSPSYRNRGDPRNQIALSPSFHQASPRDYPNSEVYANPRHQFMPGHYGNIPYKNYHAYPDASQTYYNRESGVVGVVSRDNIIHRQSSGSIHPPHYSNHSFYPHNNDNGYWMPYDPVSNYKEQVARDDFLHDFYERERNPPYPYPHPDPDPPPKFYSRGGFTPINKLPPRKFRSDIEYAPRECEPYSMEMDRLAIPKKIDIYIKDDRESVEPDRFVSINDIAAEVPEIIEDSPAGIRKLRSCYRKTGPGYRRSSPERKKSVEFAPLPEDEDYEIPHRVVNKNQNASIYFTIEVPYKNRDRRQFHSDRHVYIPRRSDSGCDTFAEQSDSATQLDEGSSQPDSENSFRYSTSLYDLPSTIESKRHKIAKSLKTSKIEESNIFRNESKAVKKSFRPHRPRVESRQTEDPNHPKDMDDNLAVRIEEVPSHKLDKNILTFPEKDETEAPCRRQVDKLPKPDSEKKPLIHLYRGNVESRYPTVYKGKRWKEPDVKEKDRAELQQYALTSPTYSPKANETPQGLGDSQTIRKVDSSKNVCHRVPSGSCGQFSEDSTSDSTDRNINLCVTVQADNVDLAGPPRVLSTHVTEGNILSDEDLSISLSQLSFASLQRKASGNDICGESLQNNFSCVRSSGSQDFLNSCSSKRSCYEARPSPVMPYKTNNVRRGIKESLDVSHPDLIQMCSKPPTSAFQCDFIKKSRRKWERNTYPSSPPKWVSHSLPNISSSRNCCENTNNCSIGKSKMNQHQDPGPESSCALPKPECPPKCSGTDCPEDKPPVSPTSSKPSTCCNNKEKLYASIHKDLLTQQMSDFETKPRRSFVDVLKRELIQNIRMRQQMESRMHFLRQQPHTMLNSNQPVAAMQPNLNPPCNPEPVVCWPPYSSPQPPI